MNSVQEPVYLARLDKKTETRVLCGRPGCGRELARVVYEHAVSSAFVPTPDGPMTTDLSAPYVEPSRTRDSLRIVCFGKGWTVAPDGSWYNVGKLSRAPIRGQSAGTANSGRTWGLGPSQLPAVARCPYCRFRSVLHSEALRTMRLRSHQMAQPGRPDGKSDRGAVP